MTGAIRVYWIVLTDPLRPRLLHDPLQHTLRGRPLVDKQHPHDLLITLSASYTLPLEEKGSWVAYFGFPGEPALGPVAFVHRASAAENPSAPLAHHLEDSTYISFGVFTTGLTYRKFKVEGSLFNVSST